MALTIGNRLGNYEIVSPLGDGGMSACGHGEPRTCECEPRPQRQFAGAPPPQKNADSEGRAARGIYDLLILDLRSDLLCH
jgi:hypothetical protein